MKPRNTSPVYQSRGYVVVNVEQAREIVKKWVTKNTTIEPRFGLPEVDDRYHIWRIPVLTSTGDARVGEVVIDAHTGVIDEARTTSPDTINNGSRPNQRPTPKAPSTGRKKARKYEKGPTLREIHCGDSTNILASMPPGCVDLVFTSPPYYNARPEYADYTTYEQYLEQIQNVIRESHRVLAEGRFFVMNISPVLIRRESRNQASRRIAVPFDMHALFIAEEFDFVDHILWEKPEGAGWATGRGRRFAADRNPLQYKPVPVTEDILVYRKKTDRLIDWNIRTYPDQDAVQRSRIRDGYEKTNIWRLPAARDKRHPAVFPEALAERVIRYYSFETDTVLDPYAGLSTTGRVANRLDRGFVMIEREPAYVDATINDIDNGKWKPLSRETVVIQR